jgi:hypothetical protein
MCSLAICKPAIRRVARPGDWVAGIGSERRGLAGKLVYAMHVQEVLSLQDYDDRASSRWPERIPDPRSLEMSRRLGDCIYEFARGEFVRQRPGVHGGDNICRDLRGRNVLLSREFYYFGACAIDLPFPDICHPNQGHRSRSNDSVVVAFVEWLRSRFDPGQIHGWPGFLIDWTGNAARYGDQYGSGATVRAEDAKGVRSSRQFNQ